MMLLNTNTYINKSTSYAPLKKKKRSLDSNIMLKVKNLI